MNFLLLFEFVLKTPVFEPNNITGQKNLKKLLQFFIKYDIMYNNGCIPQFCGRKTMPCAEINKIKYHIVSLGFEWQNRSGALYIFNII